MTSPGQPPSCQTGVPVLVSTAMILRCLLAGLLVGFAPADAAPLRDAATGLALRGEVRLVYADGRGDDRRAEALATLPADVVAIHAPGYRALRLRQDPGGAALPTTWLLTPIAPPEPPRPLAAGQLRLRGHVVDARTAAAVVGAHIRWLGHEVRSDADGGFVLELPLPSDSTAHATAALSVDHPAHPHWQQLRRLDAGVERQLVIALGAVPGLDHRWQLGSTAPEALSPVLATSTVGSATPPSSIRVGFADAACSVPCCTQNCTNVCVMDFETYVRRGLDDEWIASWPAASLAAGAVAYRAYGAWRQANPIRPQFDICSNACCQVNDADTAASSDAAVAATTGILLVRNGSRFAAEYSAENNSWDDPGDGLSCTNTDLSCGDGYVGSPATGWPCLADPVGAGWGCFGHGRGMSQWGTRGWALAGWRWPRIVEHYYNAGGTGSGLRSARMSSPLGTALPELAGNSVPPGGTLLLRLPVTQQGGAPLPRVIHQTLLRRGTPEWGDPGGDLLHTLPPGSSLLQRAFAVPAELTPGPVDLINRLWLDADGDGRVGNEDLLLGERNDAGLLTLSAADSVHADGFETSLPAPQ